MKTIPKILITGGAGFVGSSLCRYVLNQNCKVLCLDNLYTGHKNNIAQLLEHENFQMIYHDVIHPIELKVDAIYHLACPASPRHYQKDPIYTLKTNIWGTYNMLELAKANKAPLLFASTSEVYGNPTMHPQHESYTGNVNPIGPRACYDEGKRAAETLCFDFERMYQIDVHVIRIFNTYGPRMHENDGRVVSNFVTQALQGRPLTIYGDGSQTRSLCFVDDLVDGFVQMMNHPDHLKGPMNLGNPHECTIAELAHRIIELTQSPSCITYLPLPIDDPIRRRPEISSARRLLRWEPKISLDEGLQRTISYFRQVRKDGEYHESS
jgi:UDP-glucuronate decarboxylase